MEFIFLRAAARMWTWCRVACLSHNNEFDSKEFIHHIASHLFGVGESERGNVRSRNEKLFTTLPSLSSSTHSNSKFIKFMIMKCLIANRKRDGENSSPRSQAAVAVSSRESFRANYWVFIVSLSENIMNKFSASLGRLMKSSGDCVPGIFVFSEQPQWGGEGEDLIQKDEWWNDKLFVIETRQEVWERPTAMLLLLAARHMWDEM